MKTALIVTGGEIDLDFTRSFLQENPCEKVIAADRALVSLHELGLIPDYIVGDMDSVPDEISAFYHQFPYIVWDLRSPEKDETDTELALDRALTLGCGRFFLLGATGGRLDHLLANIDSLYRCLTSGVEAYLIDPQNRVFLTDDKTVFTRAGQWGKYVSFLPFSGEVKGLTLKGFRYPLKNKTLRRGQEAGLCVSNEIAADSASAVITGGVLICVESRD